MRSAAQAGAAGQTRWSESAGSFNRLAHPSDSAAAEIVHDDDFTGREGWGRSAFGRGSNDPKTVPERMRPPHALRFDNAQFAICRHGGFSTASRRSATGISCLGKDEASPGTETSQTPGSGFSANAASGEAD